MLHLQVRRNKSEDKLLLVDTNFLYYFQYIYVHLKMYINHTVLRLIRTKKQMPT